MMELKSEKREPIRLVDRLMTVCQSFGIDINDVRGIRMGDLSNHNLYGTLGSRGVNSYGCNRIIFIADDEYSDVSEYLLVDDSSKRWIVGKLMKMGFCDIDISKLLEISIEHVQIAMHLKTRRNET